MRCKTTDSWWVMITSDPIRLQLTWASMPLPSPWGTQLFRGPLWLGLAELCLRAALPAPPVPSPGQASKPVLGE